jgi:hypothetical protein
MAAKGKQDVGGLKTQGASQFLNKGRRVLISTGLQPGDEGRRPLRSRFSGFRTHRKPVETGFIRRKTGFTRLKPGANERRSKTELRPKRSKACSHNLPLPDAIEALGTGSGGVWQNQIPSIAGNQRQGRPVAVGE